MCSFPIVVPCFIMLQIEKGPLRSQVSLVRNGPEWSKWRGRWHSQKRSHATPAKQACRSSRGTCALASASRNKFESEKARLLTQLCVAWGGKMNLRRRKAQLIALGNEKVHRRELQLKRKRAPKRVPFSLWSKWRDSNSRPPVPEQILHRFLTTFVDFLVLFSPKTVLYDALVRTVSA
jgi:hypothetical protein